jgi:4-amino-4-deoxy-L-arabinose transferase-like glycosyltransferase
MSYLDHPPLVAYLIWASTKLFGTTEFAVRLPAALLYAGTAVIGTWMANRLTRDAASTWLAAVLLIVSPVTVVCGTLITPDSPLIFFVVAGLAAATLAIDDRDGPAGRRLARWLLVGACCALAMLSKYPGVLLPAAIVLGVASSRRTWIEFRRPGLYAAMLIAVICFSPVIGWNVQHHWASFAFQLNHGLGDKDSPGVMGFVNLVGVVLLTWTPVLFIVAMVAMVGLARTYRQQPVAAKLMLLMAAMPLVLFSYSSFHRKVEGNWPAVAFVPAVIVAVLWIAQQPEKRMGLARWAVGVAVAFSIVAQFP